MKTGMITKETAPAFKSLILPSIYELFQKGFPVTAVGLIEEDRPAGAVMGYIDRDGVFKLLSLYVLPQYRRRGGGTLLIQTLRALTETMDLLVLFSYLDGSLGAEYYGAFFRSLGLAEADHFEKLYLVSVGTLCASDLFPKEHSSPYIYPLANVPDDKKNHYLQQANKITNNMDDVELDIKKVNSKMSFAWIRNEELKGYILIGRSKNNNENLTVLLSDQPDIKITADLLIAFVNKCRDQLSPWTMVEIPLPDNRLDGVFKQIDGALNIQHTYIL
ncbi:MAG: GNAT family N-acetyltransferase [Lachnospiraceae bacterium]|nr:GNAT family N-acetyltransferase [Lachnospiraceae bacterium]